MASQTDSTLPQVVIVGGGFGGLQATRRLRKAPVQVTLIDKHNYHLFQPLLYQVATGALSPANIASPLRAIFRRQKNCEVLLAEVTDIDVERGRLQLADGELTFDFLILAAGGTHSYFGNDSWEQFAPGLKTIADASNIRRHIFLAFEAAEREPDPEMRQALMTFVIVGGGPTGVELAGTLSEISRHTLKHDFRRINPEDARILLVEAGTHELLSHYPEALCQCAAEKIRSLGIEIHTQTRASEITDDHVRLVSRDGETILKTRNVMWAAGVQANPLGKKLAVACELQTDRAGRVPVTETLNPAGFENIFVIGDLAASVDSEGKPLPGVAQVAMQQGRFAAETIHRRVLGKATSKKFRYRDLGSMATIGRAAAVVEIGKFRSCGFLAWVMWLIVHLTQIVQFQNRLLVFFQWGWSYLTFGRSARLITGEDNVVIVNQSQRDNEHSSVASGEASTS